MVASDRISAFDFVLDTPIPDKGEILTRMSLWWFDQLARPGAEPRASPPTCPTPVARPGGGLRAAGRCSPSSASPAATSPAPGCSTTGATGEVCGIALPAGLEDGSRLPEPIFTPATKADARRARRERRPTTRRGRAVGDDAAAELRDAHPRGLRARPRRSPASAASSWPTPSSSSAAGRDGTTVLADEVLTPDSSRFWPADEWQPGRAQPSYDKQFVRDWLTSPESGWDRASGEPPPPLPDEVVERTRARYVEAYERLTGESW